MRRDEIDSELSNLVLEFFYRFSRFESALKENEYLISKTPGVNAQPYWDGFVEDYSSRFQHSDSSKRLLSLNPERQIMGESGELSWREVGLEDCRSDLCETARLLKTIRNNLFHGGKHGSEGWDNPIRVKQLLTVSVAVMDELALTADWKADYERRY